MKIYVARIYCPYEGGTYAMGIFSTREKAEQCAPWFTEHKEYFREEQHKAFCVEEYEIDNPWEFHTQLGYTMSFLEYYAKGNTEIPTEPDTIAAAAVLSNLREKYAAL